MTAPLMPKATAVWLVENTTLTFKQIGDFCELHELEVQAIADGDVAFNIVGLNPVTGGQLTADEIARCEQDPSASLVGVEPERNVKAENSKNKKVLSPSQRSDKPAAILWILRNCPEIIDSQICKLIGTTKPTIASLRDGTHRDMANLRPKNPVAVGLCKEKDLDEAIAVSKKWTELKSQPKKTVKKKAGKSAAKAKAAAARKKEAEKLKNPAFAKTWIYRIVINTAISQLRKKRETVSLDEAAEIAVNASYGNADLQKALSGLTDEQKTLIRLRFFEDMKLEEIAMVMDENPNTIKSRLYRTLKELQVKMA